MTLKIEEIELPDNLDTISTTVTVKLGSNHWLSTPALFNSNHDIILQKNTNIGRPHQIPSITPLQEQERHAVLLTNEVKSDTRTEVVSHIKTK